MVNGSVAEDERVENAVSSGVVKALKCFKGCTFPTILIISGSVIVA